MRSLFDSFAFIAWAIPFFIVLELVVPRQRMAIRWRAIVLAGLVLAVNTVIVRVVPTATPTALTTSRIVLAFIATDVAAYWLHRAMHAIPLLWRVHRMHHVDVPLAWHQSWWIHPIDIALFAAVAAASTWLVGAPLVAAPWFLLVRRAWGILLHANVKWPATWLDHLIVTPNLHHRHHREDQRPANFAPSFALLDRLFGTWSR